jgi:hypothetical protein
MTVRELLIKENDYSVVKIVKDGEILWNEFRGWNGINKKLLNLKVLKYEFDIKVWLTGNKGGYYQILVVEVE